MAAESRMFTITASENEVRTWRAVVHGVPPRAVCGGRTALPQPRHGLEGGLAFGAVGLKQRVQAGPGDAVGGDDLGR